MLDDLQVCQLKRILFFFTDGSYDQHSSETDTNNAWSMIVIAQHLDGQWVHLGGTGASFHQDASLHQINGPISSGGAEGTRGPSLPRRSTSQSRFIQIACSVSQGPCADTHSCPTHAILLDICTSLFQTVRMTRRVSRHHVMGHSGHPWNEMADRLVATAARRRWRCSPLPPQQFLCLHQEHLDVPLQIGPLRWAFLLHAPAPLAASYPIVDDDQLVCPFFFLPRSLA